MTHPRLIGGEGGEESHQIISMKPKAFLEQKKLQAIRSARSCSKITFLSAMVDFVTMNIESDDNLYYLSALRVLWKVGFAFSIVTLARLLDTTNLNNKTIPSYLDTKYTLMAPIWRLKAINVAVGTVLDVTKTVQQPGSSMFLYRKWIPPAFLLAMIIGDIQVRALSASQVKQHQQQQQGKGRGRSSKYISTEIKIHRTVRNMALCSAALFTRGLLDILISIFVHSTAFSMVGGLLDANNTLTMAMLLLQLRKANVNILQGVRSQKYRPQQRIDVHDAQTKFYDRVGNSHRNNAALKTLALVVSMIRQYQKQQKHAHE